MNSHFLEAIKKPPHVVLGVSPASGDLLVDLPQPPERHKTTIDFSSDVIVDAMCIN